jgi:thiamine monophosphate synthase
MCCSLDASRRAGDGGSEEDENPRGARAAAERRLRGGTGSGSGELLAIPGVGPRNLRKLVDNGFEGVAHLKQLYRDKVRVRCSAASVRLD